MMYKLFLWLIAAVMMSIMVLTATEQPLIYTIAASVIGILLAAMAYMAVHKPLKSIKNGLYLLQEQDFSSRLRLTGQRDADKVVTLFNSLMSAMKNERLKQQEQSRLLSMLIEASPMGIAICNFDDIIINRNKAYTQIVSDNLESQILNLNDDEVRIIRTDNSQVFRCSKLWFMDTGFRRRFILVELMTEEILRAEKQMFSRIVRTIGHEVNNTMGSVVSVLDTLKTIHSSENYIEQTIDSSSASCMNLAEFVKGYSSLVKLPEPVPEPVDLNYMIQQMQPTLCAMMPRNITLSIHPNPEAVIKQIDDMLIPRVISNIVKNSIESIADRPDGAIDITVNSHGLEITDNGAGISAKAAEQLFTPFFSTKRPDRGLGLMLVADILRAHKATFSLSTDPNTKLTTFTINMH